MDTLLVEQRGAWLKLTLNRPEVLNAMNRQLVREMHHAMHAFEADDDVGCIVFTGAGEKAFSAGGDIHEQRSDDKLYTLEQQAAMSAGISAYDVAACKKPTIGMMASAAATIEATATIAVTPQRVPPPAIARCAIRVVVHAVPAPISAPAIRPANGS